MRGFWTDGYDGASVDAMCRVTNMSRASLYQVYGGKEGLFLAAVAHYGDTRAATVAAALGPKGSLREDLGAFFAAVVDLATVDPQTPGCLISCVLADVAGSNLTFRAELDRRFEALETRLATRFRQACWPETGEVTPAAAAGLAAAAARGIMLRARSGQSRADLSAIGAAAVAALVQLSA
jgi:TetR/AcrR family transcriptional regulator, copper-responsive repressor